MRVPWTARRSNQSILKEISRGYSLEGLMQRLKLQYFGHLMPRADSLETPMTHRLPLFSHPCHSPAMGTCALMLGVGIKELSRALCLLCAPLPSPGVQASLPGTRCQARGTGCQEKEKTILKYLSAHSFWKFRIMWLSRACEINLLTSPRGRHEYLE